ncbi:MAG: imelysin family protein [Labilithrix sp.]|nr:imelysin family protein [Labilithrix sp.]
MKRYIGAFVAAAVLCGTSCRSRSGDPGAGSSSGSVDAGSFDKPALLRAFGECVVADYRELSTSVVALDAATSAAASDKSAASLEAARAAWKTAMEIAQRAEVYQFGPAAISTAPGGRDMRDPIYAWPLVGRCALEQTIVSKAYETPGWATSALVSTRSLAAAEYLLFFTGAENECPAESEINTNGSWAALGAEELAARRLAYARVVTADVVQRTQALVDAWDPAKGNFIEELATAGRSKSFASEQMAFNAVTDAMFYVDLQLKNSKVGKPAGFLPDCAAAPCLSAVESPWAKRSKEHIRQNLAGYEKLFRGCGPGGSGLGFDDLLGAVGAESVTAKVEASLVEIRAALDALVEPTFEEDLQKNIAGVQRLFDALRANAALMKAEFVTVLDLELPKRVEGDND